MVTIVAIEMDDKAGIYVSVAVPTLWSYFHYEILMLLLARGIIVIEMTGFAWAILPVGHVWA